MKILGLLNNKLCILIEGERIIIETSLSDSDLADVLNYQNLPIFNNWDEVEISAYGQ